MPESVLILGGYGNFGKRIAAALCKKNLAVTIAGRDKAKAEAFARTLPTHLASTACFDVWLELGQWLEKLRPGVVVNTCGPFQGSNYTIAETCISHNVHYIDLADGRDFVAGCEKLDEAARAKDVTAIFGASTVPGLSSAVIEKFLSEFSEIDSLLFGITPGQKAERGLATTKGILSYIGRPLRPFAGSKDPAYGWQDIYRQEYPVLGKRWMANCDIPDLDLLPARYGIKTIQFSAGLQLSLLHLGLWILSWLVRWRVPFDLPKHAQTLLSLSDCFNQFGTADGGMHMVIRGKDFHGADHIRRWFIIAKDGHGPHIPTVPAIILATKFAHGQFNKPGSMSCVGLVTLDECLDELADYNVTTICQYMSANLAMVSMSPMRFMKLIL